MEPKEDLKEYIKREIGKSGFPLEIRTATLLNQKGWSILPHMLYPHEKEGESDRELDIRAVKTQKNGHIQDILIIECKKQENKPWVFFEQDGIGQELLSLNISPLSAYQLVFANYGHYKNLPCFRKKPCTYHFPMFVKNNIPDPILEAVNQVVDALIYCWDMEVEMFEKLEKKKISFLYPVIVLDGRLFSARIDSNGDIDLKEETILQLKVSKALKAPMEIQSLVLSIKPITIDVVTKDYFEKYLDNYSE